MSVSKKYQSSIDFPDPRQSLAEGIVAVGGVLDTGTLYTAYLKGIFPWPQSGLPLLWFCPDQRGILDFRDFKVPESLERFHKKNSSWQFTINKSFHQVLDECAKQSRPGQDGTWLTSAMKRAYLKFFEEGYCLSVEVRENNILIGGVYGVLVQGVFSGESMFFKKSNASKMALWYLVELLKSQGHQWMDVQMVTPVVASFGGKYIDKADYLKILKRRHQEFAASDADQ